MPPGHLPHRLQPHAGSPRPLAGQVAAVVNPQGLSAGIPYHQGDIARSGYPPGPQPAAPLPLKRLHRVFQQIAHHQTEIRQQRILERRQLQTNIRLKAQLLPLTPVIAGQGLQHPAGRQRTLQSPLQQPPWPSLLHSTAGNPQVVAQIMAQPPQGLQLLPLHMGLQQKHLAQPPVFLPLAPQKAAQAEQDHQRGQRHSAQEQKDSLYHRPGHACPQALK